MDIILQFSSLDLLSNKHDSSPFISKDQDQKQIDYSCQNDILIPNCFESTQESENRKDEIPILIPTENIENEKEKIKKLFHFKKIYLTRKSNIYSNFGNYMNWQIYLITPVSVFCTFDEIFFKRKFKCVNREYYLKIKDLTILEHLCQRGCKKKIFFTILDELLERGNCSFEDYMIKRKIKDIFSIFLIFSKNEEEFI